MSFFGFTEENRLAQKSKVIPMCQREWIIRIYCLHSNLNRESMYRMLSQSGNPQLSSLSAILQTMGLELSVKVKETKPV